jgi:TonB family protein
MRHNLAASILLSPLLFSAAAVASSPATDAPASTHLRPVSTGVVYPQLVSSTDINLPSNTFNAWSPASSEVVLQLKVDATGAVQDAQVVKSLNPQLNAPVLSAVRNFRFRPATLDKQAVPVDMNLVIQVQR